MRKEQVYPCGYKVYDDNNLIDRQLSYEELIELDREFDRAFVVDEDCEDDWSDKGLGANARLTYIDQRRTGQISGPEEFDCDEKWRKSIKR